MVIYKLEGHLEVKTKIDANVQHEIWSSFKRFLVALWRVCVVPWRVVVAL